MSKGELAKGVSISTVIAIVFSVIGYFVVTNALQMVAIFGEGLGIDARSRAIYAQSHTWVHVFAAACGLAIGWFYRQRSWGLLTLVVIGVIACGSYGVLNMYGFGASNRTAVAAAKDSVKAAEERQYLATRADIEARIKWLEGQVAEAETKREKMRFERQIDEKRKQLSAVKPPVATAENVLSDAGAVPLSELTRTEVRTWLIWLPLIFAVLMFLAESASFLVVGHAIAGIVVLFAAYLAAPRTEEPAKKPEPGKGSGGSGSGGSREPDSKVVHIEPAKAGIRGKLGGSPLKVSSVGSRVSTDAPSRKLTFDQFADTIRHDLAHGEPASSTRTLARATGWSQTSVVRQQKKVKGKVHHHPRRFAGNGGGMHVSARG